MIEESMEEPGRGWEPPVRFFRSGRQRVVSRHYDNDCRADQPEIRRLLIKRTVRGCGTLYAGGVRVDLPENTMFMIERPGSYRYCYEGNGEPWEFEYASLWIAGETSILPTPLRNEPVWDGSRTPSLGPMLRRIVERRQNGGARIAESFAGEAFAESASAYRFYLACIGARLDMVRPVKPVARQLKQELEENFAREIHLKQVALRLGYTPEALGRVFRDAFGETPIKYLNRVRVEQARGLLEETRVPAKEIARRCGFSSLNYFCRIFRNHMGLSPSAYRANPDPLVGFPGQTRAAGKTNGEFPE